MKNIIFKSILLLIFIFGYLYYEGEWAIPTDLGDVISTILIAVTTLFLVLYGVPKLKLFIAKNPEQVKTSPKAIFGIFIGVAVGIAIPILFFVFFF